MLVHWWEATPQLHTTVSRYMLETVGIRVAIASPYPLTDLNLEIWTNAPTRWQSADEWYALTVPHQATDDQGRHHFGLDLQPTSAGNFGLTYRVRHRDRQSPQWLGQPHTNVNLQVAPPAPEMDWTQRPNHVEVLPGIYVGNFIAASQAAALGFDAVLNMAEELDLTLPDTGAIAYRKLSCRDGARHPIPEAQIQAAIAWLEKQRRQGKRQILIHCRAGIGRSGSIGVAYCFFRHPHWSYQQALDYVWSKKPDVYPHTHLQASLEVIFPRPNTL